MISYGIVQSVGSEAAEDVTAGDIVFFDEMEARHMRLEDDARTEFWVIDHRALTGVIDEDDARQHGLETAVE